MAAGGLCCGGVIAGCTPSAGAADRLVLRRLLQFWVVFFCAAGKACKAAVRSPSGVVRAAAVRVEGSLCETCASRVVPEPAKPAPSGRYVSLNGTGPERALDGVTEIQLRGGGAVRIDEDGLPIDVLEGSPYALLPEN